MLEHPEPTIRGSLEGRSAGDLAPSGAAQRIEAYVDLVCVPLAGRVPAARLGELRAELRSHLEALVEAYQELGCGPEEAVGAAVKQLGDPRRVTREWICEWEQPARPRAGAAFLAAGVLGVSGSFGGLLLVALEHHLGHSAFELALGGPLLPLAAGFSVGLWRGKHPLGSRWGLLLIVAVSAGISLLMTSADPRPPLVGMIRVLMWTMTACAAAGLGALFSGWRDRAPLKMARL